MIPHVNDSKNEFEDVDLQYGKENTKHVKWYHKVLLNRTLKVVLSLILVAILAPILLYQFIFFTGVDLTSPDGFSLGSCLVARQSRLPCGIGNVTAEECHQQCCYDHSNHLCFHRYPSRFSYILDRRWADEVALKPRVATVPYKLQNSLTNIRLAIDEVSSTHMTMTFYYSDDVITGRKIKDKVYEYQVETPELNVNVNSPQGTVFNTMRGPLIASENIWEIAFKLTNESMYGLGEIPIKAETVKVIYNHRDGLSSIPLIYAKINASYHGLLIDTVNPTEVTFREDNVIMIRSITNFGLKFHLFVGPEPADVMKDVMKYVGFERRLEYWMLGLHICNEFPEVEDTKDINAFIQEASAEDMPFESHCVRPIVFDNQCDPNQVAHINEGAKLLKKSEKKFVPHVSPYILYESTNTTETNDTDMTRDSSSNCSYNIVDYSKFMLQSADSEDFYKGLVENSQVIYPDYANTSAELLEKLWMYTTDMDGVVLENNWPLDESDKVAKETYRYLPYFSQSFEAAFNHTPAWNATKSNGELYFYNHSEYGNKFLNAFTNITSSPMGASSLWMTGNAFVSRQNIPTSWSSLQKELIEAALGGISGHWMWSTPICGSTDNFNNDTHASLCVKWYLTAAYMPMIKIHSKNSSRDPLSFTGYTRSLMITALRNRLTIAPYLYSTLQEGPILRPMFYQYPQSECLKDLTSQFNIGNDMMMIPNLQPSQSMVHVIMPPEVWYETWSGLKITAEECEAVTMSTTEADLLTFIRGGSIIVMQQFTSLRPIYVPLLGSGLPLVEGTRPQAGQLRVEDFNRLKECQDELHLRQDVKLTAELTRAQSNFDLTVALECQTNEYIEENEVKNITKCSASGSLSITADTTIHLQTDGEELRITGTGDFDIICGANPAWARFIKALFIFGLSDELNNFDYMKYVDTEIDLCALETASEIVFNFVS